MLEVPCGSNVWNWTAESHTKAGPSCCTWQSWFHPIHRVICQLQKRGVSYSASHSPDVPGIPIWEMNEINSSCCSTLTYGWFLEEKIWRHCIWGVSDLEQTLSALLGLVLGAWEAIVLAWLTTVSESFGVSHAGQCCTLLDVMRDDIPACQEKIYDLLVTQNKRHHDMGWGRKLSTDRICAEHHRKIHPASAQYYTEVGVPST